MTTAIIGESRGGSGGITLSGRSLAFRSSVKFLVVSDELNVSREAVLVTTEGLPIVGLRYGAFDAVCVSMNAERKPENPYYWDVTCEFDTSQENQKQNPANPSPDPTSWLPVFKIDGFETMEKVLTLDEAGSPIVNSVGDQFETPLMATRLICYFSFIQYEDPSQDIDVFLERNDVVNETAFAGRDPRTLRLNVISAELGTYGTYAAWKTGYRVSYDRETWDVKILDYGSSHFVGGDKKPYLDDDGMYKIYGKLDGAGAKTSGDAAELSYQIYPKVEFADFIRT